MQRPLRKAAPDSAARLWAPLAHFIEAKTRLGEWAGARPPRARSTRGSGSAQAGVGVPVRALMLALLLGTFAFCPKVPCSPATIPAPGRIAISRAMLPSSSWRPGGGQGDPRVPCCRYRHGDLQDLGRLVDLSRAELLFAWVACRCSRASCTRPWAPTSPAPGASSISASPAIPHCGRSRWWRWASTSTSSPTTTCGTPVWCCSH